MRVLVKYRSMSTSLGLVRNGDIIDLPQDEVNKILLTKPLALEALPELPLKEPKPKAAPKKPAAKKAPAKRKRARKADGTLKADDPSTPDVNEAWEDGKHLN
jgi:hypothetical protein